MPARSLCILAVVLGASVPPVRADGHGDSLAGNAPKDAMAALRVLTTPCKYSARVEGITFLANRLKRSEPLRREQHWFREVAAGSVIATPSEIEVKSGSMLGVPDRTDALQVSRKVRVVATPWAQVEAETLLMSQVEVPQAFARLGVSGLWLDGLNGTLQALPLDQLPFLSTPEGMLDGLDLTPGRLEAWHAGTWRRLNSSASGTRYSVLPHADQSARHARVLTMDESGLVQMVSCYWPGSGGVSLLFRYGASVDGSIWLKSVVRVTALEDFLSVYRWSVTDVSFHVLPDDARVVVPLGTRLLDLRNPRTASYSADMSGWPVDVRAQISTTEPTQEYHAYLSAQAARRTPTSRGDAPSSVSLTLVGVAALCIGLGVGALLRWKAQGSSR